MFTRLLLGFLLLVPGASQAQQVFSSFSFAEGLHSSNIQKVLQDKNGFIWVATQDGLFRYNGHSFDAIKKGQGKRSLQENFVFDICLGPGDSLYAAVFPTGINVINSKTLITNTVKSRPQDKQSHPGLEDTWIQKILYTSNDLIWAGSDNCLFIIDRKKNNFKYIGEIPGVSQALDITFIKEVNGDLVAVGVRQYGIILFNRSTTAVEKLIPMTGMTGNNTEPGINDMLVWNDTVLICYDHSIYTGRFENGEWKQIAVYNDPALKMVSINSIAHDSNNGSTWLGTSDGLAKIDPVTNKIVYVEGQKTLTNLHDNPVAHVFIDDQRILWVSSSKMLQATSLYPSPFKAFTGRNESRMEHIYTIDTLNSNTIITTGKKGLFLTDLKKAETRFVTGTGGVGTIHHVHRLNENTYIASSDNGLYLWIPGKNIFSREMLLQRYPEWTPFSRNFFNNSVEVGTDVYFASDEQEGLLKWDTQNRTIKQFKKKEGNEPGLPEGHLHNIKLDREGNLWLLFDKFIASFDTQNETITKSFSYPSGDRGPSAGIFFDMFDAGDKLWFATYGGGINSWDKRNGKWSSIAEVNGLCNNSVYAILPEKDSIFWVSTNMGVSRVNYHLKSCNNYYVEDGLQDNSFDEKSYFKNADKIYFGGINGFTEINTAIKRNPIRATPKYIYKVEYYAGALKSSNYDLEWDKLVLPAGTRLLSLYTCSLKYPVSGRNNFFYRFSSNADSNFIPVGPLNRIDIHVPGHGNYTVEIIMKNENGETDSDSMFFSFYITPRWHQTWWFKSLMVLALLSIIYGLYRMRIDRLKKEERIRNQLASDLHDDLGSTLNSIKVHSNLAIMEKANPNHLVMIKQGAQDAITGIRDIIWVLDDKKDQLADMLSRVTQFAGPLCEASAVRYVVEADDSIRELKLGKEEKRNLYMIIKESINNSLKYAQSTSVRVMAERKDKKLRFVISDDGKGFDLAAVKTGYGIRNIMNRAKTIGYIIQINTAPGKGTTIILEKK